MQTNILKQCVLSKIKNDIASYSKSIYFYKNKWVQNNDFS